MLNRGLGVKAGKLNVQVSKIKAAFPGNPLFHSQKGCTSVSAFFLTMSFLKKLSQPHIWERVFYERLTEPLHLNLLSLGMMAFGSFRTRVKWDLVVRQHNAFSILK